LFRVWELAVSFSGLPLQIQSCHNNEPVLRASLYFSALDLGSFSQVLLWMGLAWFITFWPKRNESQAIISTERFETAWRASVANGVAPAHWSVVAVSLRSQMLYPVELRAPERGS
jgi:hypothetical protein